MTAPLCPLCSSPEASAYHEHPARRFWRCATCALVFVAPSDYPDPRTERARYDQHQNNPSDARYRAFLSTLATPLLDRLAPGAHGLDFGCGPGPALAELLREAGMDVDLYDIYYAPDDAVWTRRYDFVTATEVVEHLHAPAKEFERLFSAVTPGGWLAVMTKWVSNIPSFAKSRYVRDPTHVCLYSRETFRWIARRWNVDVEFPADDVALCQVK